MALETYFAFLEKDHGAPSNREKKGGTGADTLLQSLSKFHKGDYPQDLTTFLKVLLVTEKVFDA